MRQPRPWTGLLLLFAILGNVALAVIAVQQARDTAALAERVGRMERAPRVVGFDVDGNPVVAGEVTEAPLPATPTPQAP